MAATALMLFKPAVQHIGVHAMRERQRYSGRTVLFAGCDQLGFELRRVVAMCSPVRILGALNLLVHGVHDGLRAHDLARLPGVIQDGMPSRLH